MKLLVAFFITILSTSAFARRGGDPTVPWPTNVIREQFYLEEIRGEWVAYSHNTVWLIRVLPQSNNRLLLMIRSEALFTNKGTGLLYANDNVFWGQLIMDGNHISAALIYKDQEGLKLRIAKDLDTYYDLELYRTR